MSQTPSRAHVLDPASPELDAWLRRVGVVEAFVGLAALVPDAAVIVTDPRRRVLLWSAEAERLLGRAREQVLGASCPGGVLCDVEGQERAFGAMAKLPRPDGTWVEARHYRRVFEGPDGPIGTVHLLVAERDPQGGATRPSSVDGVSFHGIVSREPTMKQIFELIKNVAETDATVLVRGESGSGKELVARAIHAESHRRDRPFIAVNCAAFTQTLLESELFGHVRGAFTGASANRRGIFAQADGGTLFLDEVAELPLETQAKLLRVLQERTFVPVGGTEPIKVDVRIVAATHRALREMAKIGRFREDLLYRLRVVPIFLPALRERRRDIELLLRHFVDRYNQRGPRRVTHIAPDALKAMLDHTWPGNVRELQNVVEYSFAVGRGEELRLDELPPEFRVPTPSAQSRPPTPGLTPPAAPPSAEAERARLERAIEAAGGDLVAAAAAMGVSRTTFWRLRKKYGV